MSCVSIDMRGIANGFAVFMQLMLGGLPAPYAVGMLGQVINLQIAMGILMSELIIGGTLCAVVWFWTSREIASSRSGVVHDEKRDIKLIE